MTNTIAPAQGRQHNFAVYGFQTNSISLHPRSLRRKGNSGQVCCRKKTIAFHEISKSWHASSGFTTPPLLLAPPGEHPVAFAVGQTPASFRSSDKDGKTNKTKNVGVASHNVVLNLLALTRSLIASATTGMRPVRRGLIAYGRLPLMSVR